MGQTIRNSQEKKCQLLSFVEHLREITLDDLWNLELDCEDAFDEHFDDLVLVGFVVQTDLLDIKLSLLLQVLSLLVVAVFLLMDSWLNSFFFHQYNLQFSSLPRTWLPTRHGTY